MSPSKPLRLLPLALAQFRIFFFFFKINPRKEMLNFPAMDQVFSAVIMRVRGSARAPPR